MERAYGDLAAGDPADPGDEGFALVGGLLAGLDPLAVPLRVRELQRVGALQPDVVLRKAARIEHQLESLAHRQREVLVALGADFEVLLDVLLVEALAAPVAFDPEPLH